MNPFVNQPKPRKLKIHKPVLKVMGLGGGGSNAITRMMELGLGGVDFIAANTDRQVLKSNPAPTKLLLGSTTTRGLGAGGDPRLGEAAARESSQDIAYALSGADMVFLTAGMGGGTGTGAIPIAAEIANKQGAVTIAIVTTPFSFEMGTRQKNATNGLAKLRTKINTLIAIPNDRLLKVAPRDLPMEVAFNLADDVLRQAVQGITELITEPGTINVDFAHIRRIMKFGGGALMSIGQSSGPEKALQAVEQALNHPLLDSIQINNATGIIANFSGGTDLALNDIDTAVTYLQDQANHKPEIVLGLINDDRLEDRAQVILIITGIGAPTLEETFSHLEKPESPTPKKKEQMVVEDQQQINNTPALPNLEIVSQKNNLDIPAFLRNRTGAAG